MEQVKPIWSFLLWGIPVDITLSLVIQWVIIIATLILGIVYKKSLKKVPGKVQAAVEVLLIKMSDVVKENMGEGKEAFIPYMSALALYILLLNLTGMFGLKPPTSELSVTIGLALTTFIVIQGYTIKKNGVKGYFIGYAKPVPILLPINIIERVMLPVSLSLRLFGNVFAATIIIDLIYDFLGKLNFVATIGLPIPFHFYFDLFDGAIQSVIFVMLTMINIKIISEH